MNKDNKSSEIRILEDKIFDYILTKFDEEGRYDSSIQKLVDKLFNIKAYGVIDRILVLSRNVDEQHYVNRDYNKLYKNNFLKIENYILFEKDALLPPEIVAKTNKYTKYIVRHATDCFKKDVDKSVRKKYGYNNRETFLNMINNGYYDSEYAFAIFDKALSLNNIADDFVEVFFDSKLIEKNSDRDQAFSRIIKENKSEDETVKDYKKFNPEVFQDNGIRSFLAEVVNKSEYLIKNLQSINTFVKNNLDKRDEIVSEILNLNNSFLSYGAIKSLNELNLKTQEKEQLTSVIIEATAKLVQSNEDYLRRNIDYKYYDHTKKTDDYSRLVEIFHENADLRDYIIEEATKKGCPIRLRENKNGINSDTRDKYLDAQLALMMKHESNVTLANFLRYKDLYHQEEKMEKDGCILVVELNKQRLKKLETYALRSQDIDLMKRMAIVGSEACFEFFLANTEKYQGVIKDVINEINERLTYEHVGPLFTGKEASHDVRVRIEDRLINYLEKNHDLETYKNLRIIKQYEVSKCWCGYDQILYDRIVNLDFKYQDAEAIYDILTTKFEEWWTYKNREQYIELLQNLKANKQLVELAMYNEGKGNHRYRPDAIVALINASGAKKPSEVLKIFENYGVFDKYHELEDRLKNSNFKFMKGNFINPEVEEYRKLHSERQNIRYWIYKNFPNSKYREEKDVTSFEFLTDSLEEELDKIL